MKSLVAATLGGLAVSLPLAAHAHIEASAVISGTRLDIVARGDVTRVPDVAIINAGVITQAVDAAGAMQQNAAQMARMIAALKAAGVADRDVSTSSISLSPQYRYADNQAPQVTGYTASNQVTVRFRNVARSGAILDTLVKEGANQINGPTLTIDQPDAAQDEARMIAVKAARTRADLYARATGLKVKRIISISEADPASAGPVPVATMARSAAVEMKSEVLPGEQSVGVTVSVVFELE